MRKAKQSRPARKEVLEGIGYEPLTFPASLHVLEALRAAEDRSEERTTVLLLAYCYQEVEGDTKGAR
jgi:hypothetical protein